MYKEIEEMETLIEGLRAKIAAFKQKVPSPVVDPVVTPGTVKVNPDVGDGSLPPPPPSGH